MLEPAKSIIKAFGGVDIVAEIVKRDRTSVFRWTYPKSKGGTDGLIPSNMHGLLYAAALERDISISAEQFMPPQEKKRATA